MSNISEEILNVVDDYEDSTRLSCNQIPEEFSFALPGIKTNINMAEEARYTYPTQLTNSFDRENWTISTDHCYARPWNWRPEGNFLRPTKTLFIQKLVPTKYVLKKSAYIQEKKGIIDVESEEEATAPFYDVARAKSLMEECEKHAFAARPDSEEDWEEKVFKTNWTSPQHKIFNAMVRILNKLNLAKLTYLDAHNEPLLRRIAIDKAVERTRRLFATSFLWDIKLAQWIHQIFIEHLGPHYLACYLDILQSLKSKLPSIVDKMMQCTPSSVRMSPLNASNLASLLEKRWDLTANNLMQEKPRKLPMHPIIILVPSGPIISKNVYKWLGLLSDLATVVTITPNFGSTGHRMTMPSILDQLFSITRRKIHDIKNDYPGRHIILIGFNSGASLAMHVAQLEPVLCVISVGFTLKTTGGTRGEPDDNILELQCPVLFVIGQCANNTNQEDLEDMRERMRVETGLLVIGSADEYLRISKKKMRQEGITQTVMDRYIVDEIGEFISSLILSPYPPKIRQSPAHVSPDIPLKKGNTERKRYNSNASSLDSEPPSPTPVRINRPVGRPPCPKKTRLDAKWAQQLTHGNTPPNPEISGPVSPPTVPPISLPGTSGGFPPTENLLQSQSQPSTFSLIPKPPDQAVTPVKKIKTLKPVISSDAKIIPPMMKNQPPTTPKSHMLPKNQLPQHALIQKFGKNKTIQGTIGTSNFHGGIKTILPNPPIFPKASTSGITVLENVTLNSSESGQILPNRPIDLSKLSFINSSKTPSTSVSNVLLLPDGKIKTIASTVKGSTSTSILLSTSSKKSLCSGQKIITGKRQLMNQKARQPIKKPLYMPVTSADTSLPPPTNLTTQDILDLPIIFADDNQILGSASTSANSLQSSTPSPKVSPTSPVKVSPSSVSVKLATPTSSTKIIPPTALAKVLTPTSVVQQVAQVQKPVQLMSPAKFMLVNKQTMGPANFLFSQTVKKGNPVFQKPPTPKYTKIILSSKKSNLEGMKTATATSSKIQSLPSEITVKKVFTSQGQPLKSQATSPATPTAELFDLENEIKATSVPKPNLPTSDVKNVKIVSKNPMVSVLVPVRMDNKRPFSSSSLKIKDDPNESPPKNIKLE